MFQQQSNLSTKPQLFYLFSWKSEDAMKALMSSVRASRYMMLTLLALAMLVW